MIRARPTPTHDQAAERIDGQAQKSQSKTQNREPKSWPPIPRKIEPNLEQVECLRSGSVAWREWRRENISTPIMLFGAKLSGLHLEGAFLVGANLAKADLRKTNLSEARLLGAQLHQANLSRASLKGAKLSQAKLIKAIVRNADLTEADCPNADFSQSRFHDSILSGANLYQTNFSLCQLNRSRIISANLHRADLTLANLGEALLVNSDLSETILNSADLRGADLTFSSLSGAQLLGSDLSNAKLTGACVADWNINKDTRLFGIECDYVFLDRERMNRMPLERNFEQGEFEKIFKKSANFIDFILRDGADWLALADSLKRLRVVHNDIDTKIERIENSEDGVVVIRIRLQDGGDQEKVSDFLRLEYNRLEYEKKIAAAEVKHYERLSFALEQANVDKNHHIDMLFELLRLGMKERRMTGSDKRTINTSGGAYIEGLTGNYQEQNFIRARTIGEFKRAVEEHLTESTDGGHSSQRDENVVAHEIVDAVNKNPAFREKFTAWATHIAEVGASDVALTAIRHAAKLLGLAP